VFAVAEVVIVKLWRVYRREIGDLNEKLRSECLKIIWERRCEFY